MVARALWRSDLCTRDNPYIIQRFHLRLILGYLWVLSFSISASNMHMLLALIEQDKNHQFICDYSFHPSCILNIISRACRTRKREKILLGSVGVNKHYNGTRDA